MEKKSRTEYSARNTTVAVISRVLAILMGFTARVVFTHTLSSDYVGINGLFSDILNVLALSELGVGTAITYALYKPIADGNIEKQKILMQLFKKFYYVVAGIVFVCGLAVLPFMDFLIKDQPDVPYLTLIYLMYLANSVLSYIGIYRKTLIDAHQVGYISTIIQTSSWFVQNVVQIIVLLTTRNYVLYLSIWILCTVFGNICIYFKAGKMYPYLNDKECGMLKIEEKKSLWSNVRAMMVHKIGGVLVNNTDNLLLSALVGTLSVGRYSNYFLIIGSVKQVLEQMFQGMMASVGNMNVSESKERIRRIFDAIFFMGQWVYGLITIMMFEVLDIFVGASFGELYRFEGDITFVLCLCFYFTGMRQPTLIFRDSMGLFKYDKWKAVAEAVINLAVSLVLGYFYGVIGIFLGTLISTMLTSFWVEPYMLYKHRLKYSCFTYFVRYIFYTSVTFVLWYAEHRILLKIINIENCWVEMIVKVIFTFVVTNMIYLVVYFRNKDFRFLFYKARDILEKRFGHE